MSQFDVRFGTMLRTSRGSDTHFSVAVSETLAGTLRLLRRVLIALACLSCFSVALGFAGLALGLGEGAFLLFVTCISSLAGLVISGLAHSIASEKEAGDD